MGLNGMRRHVGAASLIAGMLIAAPGTPIWAADSAADSPPETTVTSTSGGTTDIRGSAKEVGWAVLPTFLDAATSNITIKFPKAMGGGKLTFGGVVDSEELRKKRFVFQTLEKKKINWRKAFGLPWIDLQDVAMALTIANNEFSIDLDGQVAGAFGKKTRAIISIAVENKKLTGFTLSVPNASLALSKVPGLKNLPGAKNFAVGSPTVSLDAIGGKVKFKGQTVDAVAFHNGNTSSWNMGLRLEDGLKLGSLIGVRKGVVAKMGLPKSTLYISTKGLDAKVDDLPLALQQFIGDGVDQLTLTDGVTLETQFAPKNMPKEMSAPLKTIGLEDAITVSGALGGVFGGNKSVDLSVAWPSSGGHGFPFLKPMPKAQSSFFIRYLDAATEVGIATAVQLHGGKNPMYFDVEIEAQERDTGVEARVHGKMRGDWKNAAGIKGLTLKNPFLSVGINETGAFDLLMDGTIDIGKREVRASADMVLQPEASFAPEAVAFYGSLDKLPITDLMAGTAKLVKIRTGSLNKLNVAFEKNDILFMSPGAQLPPDIQQKFSLQIAGMAMDSSLWIGKKELGSVKGEVSEEGLKFNGTLDPFKIGPLALKDATLDFKANTSNLPSFVMAGEFALFKGFDEAYTLELAPDKFVYKTDTKFGGAFDCSLVAESDGLSFSPGNDFAFKAVLAANYTKAFKTVLKGALKGLEKGEKDIKKARSDVENAEKKVKSLKDKIAKAKAEAKRDQEKATRDISSAQRKVDGLQRDIDSTNKKIHDLKHDIKKDAKKLKAGKVAKKTAELTKEGTKLAGLETAMKSAKWALDAAKKAVKVTPDTSPKVIALQAELGTEEAGLKTAQGVLTAALAANKGVAKGTEAVEKGVTSVFQLKALGARGSLLGITTAGARGKRPALIVAAKIGGKDRKYTVPIEPGAKDFEKLATVAAKQMAQELVKVAGK